MFKTSTKINTLLLSTFVLLFLCNQCENNNPYDSLYDGDYQFTPTWDSLSSGDKDTFEVFRTYRVKLKNLDQDTFKTFSVTDVNDNVITDAAVLTVKFKTDATLLLYFIKPYSGKLKIKGIRPNDKEVVQTSPLPIIMQNLYRIVMDTIWGIGDTVSGRIQKRGSYSDTTIRAVWLVDNLTTDTLPVTRQFEKTLSAVNHTVSATLLDIRNNLITLDTIRISVRGFRPEIDTVICKDTLRLGDAPVFTVKYTDKDSSEARIKIMANNKIIYFSKQFEEYDTAKIITADSVIKDTGLARFTAVVYDTTGLTGDTFAFNKRIQYTLPSPQFADTGIKPVPVNQTTAISAGDINFTSGNRYRWQFRRPKTDTTIHELYYSRVYTDTMPDTVIITGIQRFGYTGGSDTLFIQPKKFKYTLDWVNSPAEVVVRRKYVYTVKVKGNNGRNVFENINYKWTITPPDTATFHIRHDSLTVKFSDSTVSSFMVKVYAVIGITDSTQIETKQVAVHCYRPILNFMQNSYSGKIGDIIRCKVTAYDINPDSSGKIDSICWKLDAAPVTKNSGNDTIWKNVFTAPGSHTLRAWAKDNDGFLSDTAKAAISITSDVPYIMELRFLKPVYLNRAVSCTATTVLPGGKAKAWHWTLENRRDTTVTTSNDRLIFTFADTGITGIGVSCEDEFGVLGPKYTDSIYVDAGKPVINHFSVRPKSALDGAKRGVEGPILQ
jgi:hypothetical protein